jgi:hypothetical protein
MQKREFLQLYIHQYSIEKLIEHIDYLNTKTILITQKNLSAEFCARYILNPEYHISYEDYYEIDIDLVLRSQPQISREALENAWEVFLQEEKNKNHPI